MNSELTSELDLPAINSLFERVSILAELTTEYIRHDSDHFPLSSRTIYANCHELDSFSSYSFSSDQKKM